MGRWVEGWPLCRCRLRSRARRRVLNIVGCRERHSCHNWSYSDQFSTSPMSLEDADHEQRCSAVSSRLEMGNAETLTRIQLKLVRSLLFLNVDGLILQHARLIPYCLIVV